MASPWLIRLNRVDCITLISVPLTLLAMHEALQHRFMSALALLYLAMTTDALDGMLARRWQLTRNFGRYLDGFMDVLIYLVTPALIVMQWGDSGVLLFALMIMVACGCVRLAVFNETGNIGDDGTDSTNELAYQGMPVFWSLFIIAPVIWLNTLGILPMVLAQWLLVAALLIFSYRMVRRGRFFKFSSLKHILPLTLGGFLLWMSASADTGQAKALIQALYLQIPLVIGGILHMVVVSRDDFPALAKPIWYRAFGANKTWRGLVVVPLLTAAGACLLYPLEWLLGAASPFSGQPLWLSGTLAGLGYVLAELPNSWVKRRLGIAAGQLPTQGRVIAIAADQLDSAIGVAVVYALWLNISTDIVMWCIASFPLLALLVKGWLHRHALKSHAR
ncbi:CDP-alcohol phosphatidyltransferase family protein [Endozoicomonas sp. YOMI1]|uniref:CDP-alcohol phosphatidyltransferase family protein n=1 Tax=Endozoicomonas sp. YOMI1 TaxID=2828739 RepID=UPI0021494FAE|nr:CDP-alcohol phosphatidyltransferase family protein [Endozoicomonas sp. YOMI1]